MFQLRHALGLRPKEMAERLGISLSRWSNLESPNNSTSLSIDMGLKLAASIDGISLDWMWFGDDRHISQSLRDKLSTVKMPRVITKTRGRLPATT